MFGLSLWLRSLDEAKNPQALERIRIGMARLPNVLEREIVACQRTLEQKISDGGPQPQRVDPHLLGYGIKELSLERGIIKTYRPDVTSRVPWYAYARTSEEEIATKLSYIAPLYSKITADGFGNFLGDALETVVFKSLMILNEAKPRFSFEGSFDLLGPLRRDGRFRKIEPPQTVSGHTTVKNADFILHGFDSGPICIECKNYREWIYPHHGIVTETIKKALDLKVTPLFIARRIHYTTMFNLLGPAGIISHETYNQYYPTKFLELAEEVKKVRSLGFSDIRATEEPNQRMIKFFTSDLLKIADVMARRFAENRSALEDYVNGDIHLAQLYNAIGSPASGNWVEREEQIQDIPYDFSDSDYGSDEE